MKEKLETVENEQKFREEILLPILNDLGFDDIHLTHGVNEYGGDIICSNRNKFDLLEWNAFVVKTGKISRSNSPELSKRLEGLITQALDTLIERNETEYGNYSISKIFIITNDSFTENAKHSIKGISCP